MTASSPTTMSTKGVAIVEAARPARTKEYFIVVVEDFRTRC